MARARITGVGGYQPGEPIGNDMIEELAGALPPEVLEGLSIQQRFWLIDPYTGEHRESNADMAAEAARRALDSAGLKPEHIDGIILSTGTPEYTLPPTVGLVQEQLGLEKVATMELRSAGAGAVQALEIARLQIMAGTRRRVLVIGSECISPVLAGTYLAMPKEKIRMRDRVPIYMFSDGAGAIVVEASDDESRGLEPGAEQAIGGNRKPGIHAVGGGTFKPLVEQQRAKRLVDLRVDVVGAGEFTPVMVLEALSGTLGAAGSTPAELDWCLIPEGNVGWLLDSMEEQGTLNADFKALEGKVFDNLADTGACGSAAVPLFLDHAWRSGMIEVGQRVSLIGVEATKWIWAGITLDWTAPAPSATEATANTTTTEASAAAEGARP